MKNIAYKKQNLNKITVKGILSDDGSYITYIDDDKNEQTIEISKCFKLMAGNEITFTLALKGEEDASEELMEEAD